MKRRPDDLDTWQEGMHQLMMSGMRQTDFLLRMSHSRVIVELIDQRLARDAGKPLPEITRNILLQSTSMVDARHFVLYEDDVTLQQLRKRLYTRIMQIPGCHSDECAYIRSWALIWVGTMTKNEKLRSRLFDDACSVYDSIIRHPEKAYSAMNLGMRHIADIMPRVLDEALLHLNLSKAYCATSRGSRDAALAAAEKNLDTTARTKDELTGI